MGRSIPPPASGNRNKQIRLIGYKCLLKFRREQEVPVTLLNRGECGEDSSSHTKVNGAHMRALLGSGKRKRNTAEIGWSHGEKYAL